MCKRKIQEGKLNWIIVGDLGNVVEGGDDLHIFKL